MPPSPIANRPLTSNQYLVLSSRGGSALPEEEPMSAAESVCLSKPFDASLLGCDADVRCSQSRDRHDHRSQRLPSSLPGTRIGRSEAGRQPRRC
jgi:hypothetical protein